MSQNFDFKNLSLKPHDMIAKVNKLAKKEQFAPKDTARQLDDRFKKYVKQDDEKAIAKNNKADRSDHQKDVKKSENKESDVNNDKKANKVEDAQGADQKTISNEQTVNVEKSEIQQADTNIAALIQPVTDTNSAEETGEDTTTLDQIASLISDIHQVFEKLEAKLNGENTGEPDNINPGLANFDLAEQDGEISLTLGGKEIDLSNLEQVIDKLEKLVNLIEQKPNAEQAVALTQLAPKGLLSELKQFVGENGGGEQIVAALKQITGKVEQIANIEASAEGDVNVDVPKENIAANMGKVEGEAKENKATPLANSLNQGQKIDVDPLQKLATSEEQTKLTSAQLKELEKAAKAETKPMEGTKAEQAVQQAAAQPKQKAEQPQMADNKYADRYAKNATGEQTSIEGETVEQVKAKAETATKSYDHLQSTSQQNKQTAPKAMMAANNNTMGQDFLSQLSQASPNNGQLANDNNVAQVKLSMNQLKAGQSFPTNAMAFQVAKQISNGNQSFQIRLDPAELGRINVKLSFKEGGNIKAHMVVERSDVFELMQRDARALEKALNDAGFDHEKVEIDLSLDQNASEQQSFKEAFNDQEAQSGNGSSNNNNDKEELEASMIAEEQKRALPSHVTSVEVDRIV